MGMLAFFPWLAIEEPKQFAEFQLIPFHRGESPGPDTQTQAILDRILGSYYSREKQVEQAVLVRVQDHELTADLSEQERSKLFLFSELLACAGLSGRRYFWGDGYKNRHNYLLVIQSFTERQPAVSMTTRRRDGSTTSIDSLEASRIERPPHVHLSGKNPCDETLLNALLLCRGSERWEAIFEAVLNFNHANTDDSFTPELETVLMVAAFGRLFDVWKESELADRFSSSLAPSEDVLPSASGDASRFGNATSVRQAWMRDLFRLRGNHAHGRVRSPYEPHWTLRNHLLLASFAFPLSLKKELEKEGRYELAEEDLAGIDAFERLACEDHFAPGDEEEEPPWNRILRDVRLRSAARKALGLLKKPTAGDQQAT